MTTRAIRLVFLLCAVYDVVLGLLFATAFKSIYRLLNMGPPPIDYCAELAALLVFVFGVCFYYVYRDPERNRDMMVLGMLMKAVFAGVMFGNMARPPAGGFVPPVFIVFAAIDIVWLVLFAGAYSAVKKAH